MIEMHATLYCDRCNATILEMRDVTDENDAIERVAAVDGSWGAEDEGGNDVCAACWKKWDADHPSDAITTPSPPPPPPPPPPPLAVR